MLETASLKILWSWCSAAQVIAYIGIAPCMLDYTEPIPTSIGKKCLLVQ